MIDDNDAPKKRGRPPLAVVSPAPVPEEVDVRTLRVKLLRGYMPERGMKGFPLPDDWPTDAKAPPLKLIKGQVVDLPRKEARELLRLEKALRADPLPDDD